MTVTEIMMGVFGGNMMAVAVVYGFRVVGNSERTIGENKAPIWAYVIILLPMLVLISGLYSDRIAPALPDAPVAASAPRIAAGGG